MAEQARLYADLSQQVHQASDIGEALRLLEGVKRRQKSGDLPTKERYELQLRAFLTLKDLTTENPAEAEELILEQLLPECLKRDAEAGYELVQHRECLEAWLNQYAESDRSKIRDRVLEQLYPRLRTLERLPATWLISRIGYRTDQAVVGLWEVIESNGGQTGNTAIAALASLGPGPSEREKILRELHRRAAKGYQQALARAMINLADPSSVEVVYESWLSEHERGLNPIQRSIVVSVLSRVLDANADDQDLQDQVWLKLADLGDRRPKQFSREFNLGQVGPNCNSRHVVPTMLRWIGESANKEKDLSLERYRIGLRLEECVRPRQLKGWQEIPTPATAGILQEDACQDTGHDGIWTTREDNTKEKAWETLLRAGHSDALGWFESAVAPETSRYMQQRVMEWLSCFRFKQLPSTVLKWIMEEYDWPPGKTHGREIARRMAATRMARSSASREAFEALLDFGLHSEGKAMMQSVYALTEVALHLIRDGDTKVVDRLVDTVVHPAQEHQRSAAAYAIERVADAFPSLLLANVDRVIPEILNEERQPHERSSLIRALAFLEGWKLPGHLGKRLKQWACLEDRWMGGSSLEVLGHRGILQESQELLSDVLGLQQFGGNWNLDPDATRSDWAPYVVGLLYHKHGAPFVPAMVSLIKSLDSLSIPQIYEWLRHSHSGPGRPSLPQTIEEALIERVYGRQTSVHSEAGVFQVLGQIAPEALAREDWSIQWDTWLPDSRVALADALGRAQLAPDSSDKVARRLKLLIDDGQYKVRRSAYRALSLQSMDALLRLCLSWAESQRAELRERAAEGCAWLNCRIGEDDTDAFETLHHKLMTDPEKSVREAASRACEERRERSWSDEYLPVVLEVKGTTNEEVLKSWCYGDALARIGDDTCIRILRERLSEDSYPPNVRYWWRKILEKMEENWRKTTQDWPEPWFAWEGTISEGQGRLLVSEGKAERIDYSIWAQPQAAPLGPPGSQWGGAMWSLSPAVLHDLDEATIELEDGRRGRLLLRRFSGDTAIFVGTGHFPE